MISAGNRLIASPQPACPGGVSRERLNPLLDFRSNANLDYNIMPLVKA